MPKYKLKILCEIALPVRDDAAARAKAVEALSSLNINHVMSVLGLGAATTTLVCEDAKDGRNLLLPDSPS